MRYAFPLCFPWPTAMYLTLFVVTTAIYMIFMNYVMAGAIVLLIGYLAPGARRRVEGRPGGPARSGVGLIMKVVRDWLPAVLGLAITTGIAPLLFLQILYKRQFYTTNLLLFVPFMLIMPALISAYCMLYLIKSNALAGRRAVLRGPVTIVAFACFFYTAWVWTENHVLSIHEGAWQNHYASHNYIYRNAEIWPRLGYWITASFSTLAVALAWQLHWGRRVHDPVNLELATRRLRSLAILGLATSAAEAWLWLLWLDTSARGTVLSNLALPYVLLALAGIATQVVCWLPVSTGANLTTRRLALISTGVVLTILQCPGGTRARRLAEIDIATLFDAHRQASQVGDLGCFSSLSRSTPQ